MNQQLRNLKTALVAALLLTLVAPAASALSRSYSVDDLTSGQWVPSESLYKAIAWRGSTIFTADFLYEVNTVGVSLEKTSANTLVVKGAFGGLLDLPFTYNGSTLNLNTNATAGGDPVYEVKNPSAHPDISKIMVSPTKITPNSSWTRYIHAFHGNGWVSDPLDEIEDSQDENGMYDLCLSFNENPVELQITYTNGTTTKIYVDTWQLDFFKPTASFSDVEEKNSVSTPRSYRGEFDFLSAGKFQLASLGGRYVGVAPEMGYAYNTSYFASNVNFMEGSYDLTTGKATLASAPYTTNLTTDRYNNNRQSLGYDFLNHYGNHSVNIFWTAERKADGSYKKDIDGTVCPLPHAAAHKGATRWVTNGGDCTTWTRLEFKFNDIVALDEDSHELDANVGVIRNTTVIPDKEVDVTLGVDILEGRLELGLANETDTFLTAKVPFVITKNEYFTTSYDVYVIQGNVTSHSAVDMSKAKLIGSVAYDAAKGGEYEVIGTFVPKVNVKPGETFTDDFTFFVRANYGRESSATGTARRASAPLEPTHHDLTTKNFTSTVGVEGIGSEGVRLEKTQRGVMVYAPQDVAVEVFNAAGMKVAQGRANSEIEIAGNGVFIVRAGGKTFKLIR